jgi:hypothetical protein
VTPVVLVPGLLCSSEIFAAQIPALWLAGPVTIASTLEGETIEAAADSILRDAPPRFALAMRRLISRRSASPRRAG